MSEEDTLYTFPALGTIWFIEILGNQSWSSADKQAIREMVDNFEQCYSRFLPHSLITQLSQMGILYDPSSQMMEMLNFAKCIYEISEGTFDITVGESLARLGYGPQLLAGEVSLQPLGQKFPLEWDSRAIIVNSSAAIDFGGFGKGWLVDEIATELKNRSYQQFVVNGGGDLFVESTEPVLLALEDPHEPTIMLGELSLTRGALAGSSAIKRQWGENLRHHHLVDPITRAPAINPAAAFVIASSARVADACATVLSIHPELENRLSKRLGISAKIIANADTVDMDVHSDLPVHQQSLQPTSQ